MLARLVAQSKSRPDVSFGRALLVAAIIGFWMLAVSARLVYLQVSQHRGLVNRARQQQQNAIETSPQRGDLIDRQGRELARSVQTVSLFVDPDQLSSRTTVIARPANSRRRSAKMKPTSGSSCKVLKMRSAASFGLFVDSTRKKRLRFWR